eukprot:scaffold100641_cov31-Tisochrysis_lutea.AAC.3
MRILSSNVPPIKKGRSGTIATCAWTESTPCPQAASPQRAQSSDVLPEQMPPNRATISEG